MKTMIVVASAAALALSAGAAVAGGKAKGPTVASPKQPIPYSQLDSYMKASPKQRASKDWSSEASTGAAADTSATARTMPNDTPSAATDKSMPSGVVNPTPEDAATGAPPPPMDATGPNADQGKGEMTAPTPDKPR